MKYVITDLGEVNKGTAYHQDLAKVLKGKVVSAGQCELLEDGWTVFGQSFGFGIKAKNSDRKILNQELND